MWFFSEPGVRRVVQRALLDRSVLSGTRKQRNAIIWPLSSSPLWVSISSVVNGLLTILGQTSTEIGGVRSRKDSADDQVTPSLVQLVWLSRDRTLTSFVTESREALD